MNASPRAQWDPATKRLVVLVLLVLLALVLNRFRAVLPPLVLAVLLAFVLDPVVDFVEARLRLSRTAATALVFILVILALMTAPVVAAPPLVRAVASLNVDFARIAANLDRLLAQPVTFLQWQFDLRTVYQQLQEELRAFVRAVATGTVDVVIGFASTLLWTIFIVLSAFYLVRDAQRVVAWMDHLAPPAFRADFVRLRQGITGVWNAFLRGQLLMALLMAAITSTADAIVGLPNALALGLLAGAMEFVPTLGPIISAVPAVLVAFFQGSLWLPLTNLWFAVLVLGLYLLIQQIEGNVLIPRVLGRSLNLHPLIVLVAVILGGSLAGILGVLIAAPTVATLRVLGEYVYRRLTDQEPFPEMARPAKPSSGLLRRLWDRLRRRAFAGRWVIRSAQPQDRADVEEISAQIWEGQDYVPEVWEEWLADPYGEFSVVELKGRVVAFGKLTRLADDEWWLQGLRVHPAYRRLGVAALLQAHQIEVAERVGQGMLRLATASSNRAVHRMVARDGFRRVAEFQYCSADPLPGPCPLRVLDPADLDDAWRQIEGSPILQAAGGLYEVSWRWLTLTRERLAAHLAAGEVWGVDLEGRLAALAIVPQPPPGAEWLWADYLEGEQAGLTVLALGLRVLAGQRGYQGVRARPVADPPLLKALETAGLSRYSEHAVWVFERILKGETDGGN